VLDVTVTLTTIWAYDFWRDLADKGMLNVLLLNGLSYQDGFFAVLELYDSVALTLGYKLASFTIYICCFIPKI